MTRIGLIIGSGVSHSQLNLQQGEVTDTPYGATTSPLLGLEIAGTQVSVIARHGLNHQWAPHAVNYRANIWAMRELGIDSCFALNVVGGIDERLTPGSLAIPDQLIDYTWGRESSFADARTGTVFTEFSEPFSARLREILVNACAAEAIPAHRGTYGVTQGPRLETAAEIDRLERDGCAMVGMTAMPEAVLAREAGIDYAILAGVVNEAAGRSSSAQSIHAQMDEVLGAVMKAAEAVLQAALRRLVAANM